MRGVERLLWLLAIIGIGACLFGYGQGWLWQTYLSYKFDRDPLVDAGLSPRAGASVLPESTLRIHETPPTTVAADAALQSSLGRLEIPRLRISVMLLEGTDGRTLLRGIGHIPGTALPGESGNSGIAGHRDTFFRGLGDIRKGDRILVSTATTRYEYSVQQIDIVLPSNVEVLESNGGQILTLVTCYPFWLAGPAPKRFVVRAARTDLE